MHFVGPFAGLPGAGASGCQVSSFDAGLLTGGSPPGMVKVMDFITFAVFSYIALKLGRVTLEAVFF